MSGLLDKALETIPIEKRIVNHAYRKSYSDEDVVCLASRNGIDLCGLPACGAHINDGEYAGIAQKASDDLTWPLCKQCHTDQHTNPGQEWWTQNVLKPMARRRYRRWLRREKDHLNLV